MSERSLDSGQTTIAFWLPKRGQALDLLHDIEDSELGFIRETKDGKIAFEDRQHRLLSPHTVSQATYSDSSAATISYTQIQQEDPLPNIFNTVEASVQYFTTASSATVLWTLAETGSSCPTIRVGETKVYIADCLTPDAEGDVVAVYPWTTTEAGVDLTVDTTAGSGSSATLLGNITIACTKTATQMAISLTNSDSTSTAFVTSLQARGKAVTADDPVIISDNDTTSEGKYGERTWPIPGPWIPDTGEAQTLCEWLVSVYKDPIPIVTVTIAAHKNATNLAEIVARDVSDRVTLVADNDTGLGIDGDFFVESIAHYMPNSEEHYTTLTLSPADSYGGFWVLNTSALGTNTKLAY